MSEEKDPLLQHLFAKVYEPLPAIQFTAKVMQHTREQKLRSIARWVLISVFVVGGAWYLFSDVLLQFTYVTTQLLSTELVELDPGWFGWMLAPVNTLGGLGALVFGIVRRFRRRASVFGYAG